MTLRGEPAGLGTLPMGCLDHEGYSMADENDFYKKFILELVPNNVNHATWYFNDLRPVTPMQPRMGTRLFNSATRWAINAPDSMSVMYSLDPRGRGKVSCSNKVWVPSDVYTYEEARAWQFEGQVRPRLIHFPLPDSPERYLWIDLSWPIRNILLPISQVNYPGEKPNCTYAQISFRELHGALAISGFEEDGNQEFWKWEGDNKRGLVFDGSPATMRVDLDLLYKQLTLPRHLRRSDFNVLAPLQVHRWDNVPYDPTMPMNSSRQTQSGALVSNYPLTGGSYWRKSTDGVAFDKFLSNTYGVQVEYPEPKTSVMVNILNTVVSSGLSFIPVVGPLLVFGSDLVFRMLENPKDMEAKDQLTEDFGVELATAIFESALGYHGMVKERKPRYTRAQPEEPLWTQPQALYSDESPDDYKLNPNIQDPPVPDDEKLKPKNQDPPVPDKAGEERPAL